MKMRYVRLYRGPSGYWRYEVEDDHGKIRWGSMKTKNEGKARARYDMWKARLEAAGRTP